ncbi:MAG: hypothetical protein HUU37_06255 [Bdellovibrionales bacterium]|nr:hypothetical protein [Bdellovibrionales bacterium]
MQKRSESAHGGLAAIGRRKAARPISPRKPMHLIFRSSRARGPWSLVRSRNRIRELSFLTARRSSVRIQRLAVLDRHLHLVVRAGSREHMQKFLRVLPQVVMFAVTGARKGNPRGRFWDALVFSRVMDFRPVARDSWRNILRAPPDLFARIRHPGG